LNPNLFAERVLATIRNDFATFESGVALPQVYPLGVESSAPGIFTLYLGTGTPPGGNRK
jgi:hypothetical protein